MLYEAYVIDDVTTRYAHLTKQCNTAAEIILHIDLILYTFVFLKAPVIRHYDVIMT